MTAEMPPAPPPEEGASRALGDLLYGAQGPPPISEKEWVGWLDGVTARDVRALHALYERTHRLVFTLALRITAHRDTAEEVTLEVFNDVWRRAGAYDPATGSVLAWIMTQTRSRALERLRLNPTTKPRDTDDGSVPAHGLDPEEVASLRVRGRLLREALAVLTPTEREAIDTFFAETRTAAAEAARLNQPDETVAARIRSGLGKLRQALARTVRAQ